MLRKINFVASISLIYVITIGTIAGMMQSSHLFGTPVQAALPPHWHRTVTEGPNVISGKPIRIVLPGSAIDLPLVDGYYDPATTNWTLTNDKAQYGVFSALANDQHGTTFIYGHGTDAVFGKIGEHHPAKGSTAQLYSESGQLFTYKLSEIRDYTPNDTSILEDTIDGKPRLVVQTCTGALSQWRTMFIYTFESVK